MTWHLTSRQLAEYSAGRADDATAMSADTHVTHCPTCRAALPVDEHWLRASWAEIRDVVDRPRRGPLERLLSATGLNEATTRLLVATPRLYRAWLVAMVVVLGCALLAAYNVRGGSMMFYLLAPVLPLAGVALAYGRGVDPAHELTAVTPMAGQRLLFIRSLAVLIPAFSLCTAAALLLPAHGPQWAPAAWLLPALTLVSGSLALSRWVHLSVSSALFAGGWMAALAATALGQDWSSAHLFTPIAQVGWAIAFAGTTIAYLANTVVRGNRA